MRLQGCVRLVMAGALQMRNLSKSRVGVIRNRDACQAFFSRKSLPSHRSRPHRVPALALEGEAPATLAAGVAREPALTAEDAGDALGDGFAAPAARGHDKRSAEKVVPRTGFVMMVEVTTTVAVTFALVSEIHGCTSTCYVANAKISKLLDADEATGPSALEALQPCSNPPNLAALGPKVKGNGALYTLWTH
jgi:hypothetical protein